MAEGLAGGVTCDTCASYLAGCGSVTWATAACGIGSQLWEGNSSTGAKLLASTTNFWTLKVISTTFEIAGCTAKDNLFKSASRDTRVYEYANTNLDHLAADIARGEGQHLGALARLLDISEVDFRAFHSFTQLHFEELFPYDRVTASEMLISLSDLMANSEHLSAYATS